MTSSIHPAILKARQQSQPTKKMSITQTFYLAHQARGKLSSEAAKSDHDLRFLVGHANLLDSLMLHLSQAEQEQEAWYNDIVSGNTRQEEEEVVVVKSSRWETIPEEDEEDSSEDEVDSDDEDFELEDDFPVLTLTPSRAPVEQHSRINTNITISSLPSSSEELDELDTEDEMEDDDGFYTLERTTSHRPPSLVSDTSDSEEDDDHTPPSPPATTYVQPVILSEKQRKAIVTTSYYDITSDNHSTQLLDENIFIPTQQNMISAY